MEPATEVSLIAHVVQLSVAPVFLLAGVGAMLGVLSNRLARTVVRARMIYLAMGLFALCALLICSVIIVLFAGAFVQVPVAVPIAVLFVAAVLAFIGALLAFLREVHLATTNLRIGPP